MAGHIAVLIVCFYAAPNAKSKAGNEIFQPWICEGKKMVSRSAFEALVRFAIIEYVPDAVHRIFENRGCGKYDHSDLWVYKWNYVESRDETSNFSSEAEVFERFHCYRGVVSTLMKF